MTMAAEALLDKHSSADDATIGALAANLSASPRSGADRHDARPHRRFVDENRARRRIGRDDTRTSG
jgi:hypothetical protein